MRFLFWLYCTVFSESVTFKVDDQDVDNRPTSKKAGMRVEHVNRESCSRKVEPKDIVTVKFTIRVGSERGDLIQERKAYRFQIGEKPYPGFETGVLGTCPGDIKKLTLPPHLAYGQEGSPELNIPGNSPLHVNLETLAIKKDSVIWTKFGRHDPDRIRDEL